MSVHGGVDLSQARGHYKLWFTSGDGIECHVFGTPEELRRLIGQWEEQLNDLVAEEAKIEAQQTQYRE